MSLHSSFVVPFHLVSMSFLILPFVLFWSCQSHSFSYCSCSSLLILDYGLLDQPVCPFIFFLTKPTSSSAFPAQLLGLLWPHIRDLGLFLPGLKLDGFLLSVDLAVCGHRWHKSRASLLLLLKASARKSWVGKDAEGSRHSVEIMQLACER